MSEDNKANPAPENTSQVPTAVTPAPAPAVAPAQPAPKSPEDDLATKLCVASLICYFAPGVVSAVLSPILGILEDGLENSAFGSALTLPIGAIIALGPVAAIVLMIVARVKAPKNTFAKVLMWVYIALFIIKLLIAIALILFFGAMVVACAEGLSAAH